MSITSFLNWLAGTRFCTAIHDSIWAEPLFEGTHVLTLTLFFGFTAMLDLRLLDVLYTDRPVSDVIAQLNTWCVRGFMVMMVSGMLLFCTDPITFYETLVFKIKMGLLLLAGLNLWIFHRTAGGTVAAWDSRKTPAGAKLAAACSLVLWVAIITCGRLIAYVVKPV